MGAVAGVIAALYAPIVWKLAQQTLFYADLDGLSELVSWRGRPGGLLDWLARGFQTTGLGSVSWLYHGLVALVTMLIWRQVFPRQQQGWWPVLSFPAAFLVVYPALLAGTSMWLLDDYSAGFRNAFGLWTMLGCYTLCRWRGAWLPAILSALLFPLLGIYPILGVIAFNVRYLPLLAVPAIAGSLLYYDLSWECAYLNSCAIFDRFRWCALNAWTVAAFLLFFVAAQVDRADADNVFAFVGKLWKKVPGLKLPESPKRRWAGLAIIAIALVVGLWKCRPLPDLRGQMTREYAVTECRWADVIAAKPPNGNALRMESAYRVLALQRLDMLPDHLFDEPFWSSQESTDAQEELMDGHELLYNYGLLLPARRYLFETMSTKHWMPRHFELLGDIALLFGENALAERNYRLLLRCPYYAKKARARLDFLMNPDEKKKLPPDLEVIANFARTLGMMLDKVKVEFFDIQQNVEQLAYNHYINVQNCDEKTARFCLSCMLLKKKHDTLALNQGLLEGIFKGPLAVPKYLQQALISSGKYPGFISPEVQQQAMAFRTDAQRVGSGMMDQQLFMSRWASSYFFYNEFVK